MNSLDILLPFYGDVSLMKETVASVRAQSDPDWRLVFVDDHQPDVTVGDWVTSLGDPRIEYHRNETNLGANANYRRALDLATADLIVFMGADDRLLPDYVARVRECFANGCYRADMYQPGVRVIDGDGQPTAPLTDRVKNWLRPTRSGLWTYQGEDLAARLLLGNWTYFPSICWRREAVARAGFNPRFNVVQDLALILDLIARGGIMMVDDQVTFEYRRHAQSDSALKTMSAHRFDEERELFALAEERFQVLDWPRAERSARRHLMSRFHALTMLPTAARRRQKDVGRSMLAHALHSSSRR